MHATGHTDRSGGGGGSWRLPPDETLQVADPKSKEEDLVYASDGHNWRSIIFSLMVIGMVIAGIVTAIYLLGYVDELLYWSGRRMRLEEFLRGELTPQRLPPAWVTPTHFVFQADDGGLAVLDTTNDTITTLVTNHTLRQLNVRGYQCSPDLRYVLFQHNVKTVFRKTFTAHYTVYDVTNDHHTPVRLRGAGRLQRARLQHAAWLGAAGALVLVADNDIYLRPSPAIDQEWRLTDTGRPGVLYNGVPDWLYQEDILQSTEALWGSPDGSLVLYAAFDDSAVGALTFPWFTAAATTGTFPATRSVRYPTPGSPNPTVKLWIVEVKNASQPRRWEVNPPPALEGQDYYLTSACWIGTKNKHIAAVWMNRAQNLSIISMCLSPNWTCVEIHSERALEDTWLDVQPAPVFAPDGDSFLLLAEIREGESDRFTHIKHVTITQQRMSVLSHGRYEVTKILAWDNYNHLVYYLGTQEKKPGQQHLYVVRDPVNEDPRRSEPLCVTCESGSFIGSSWAKREYTNCSHFGALVAPVAEGVGSAHYVLLCQGPGLPLAAAHTAKSHKLKRLLWDARSRNEPRLRELALPTRRSFEVRLPGGCKAQVQLLLPPSWREELRDAAFPVLVQVDGRPGSSQVSEKFSVDWGAYMSSHNDVVYVQLDVRGAAGQGRRAFNRRIGGVEVNDQITVIRYLLDTLKFLDETRVGVWGWGYGGYVTSMLLGSQQNIFKCGIAVSPISDWLYYNSAFTERILGLPTDNYKGYVEADATQRARNVPSHSLYLLHGLADLSAPLQHGIALAKALADAGVIFRYQSYADEDHYLVGVLEHVYRSMEDYLRECLSLDPDDTKPAPPDR